MWLFIDRRTNRRRIQFFIIFYLKSKISKYFFIYLFSSHLCMLFHKMPNCHTLDIYHQFSSVYRYSVYWIQTLSMLKRNRQKYTLTCTDVFRYMQLRHVIQFCNIVNANLYDSAVPWIERHVLIILPNGSRKQFQ